MIMKVDREVGHDWQMIPIDFGLIRSKVKVTGARNRKNHFGMIIGERLA